MLFNTIKSMLRLFLEISHANYRTGVWICSKNGKHTNP